MNLKYTLGAIVSAPLLPILYFQGKKLRRDIPSLPEAKNLEGEFTANSDKKIRLLAIGESTIAGVGVDTHENGFTGAIAMELSQLKNASVHWRVYARSGYTAERVRLKILPKIKETNWDVIVIGLGGNDSFTLNTPKRWKSTIHQLIQDVKDRFPHSTIVFSNMPPIKEFIAFTPVIKFTVGNLVEILGQELKTVVAQYDNVYYNDEVITINGWLNRVPEGSVVSDFFSDGVHPSPLTYQVWGKDTARFIESLDAI